MTPAADRERAGRGGGLRAEIAATEQLLANMSPTRVLERFGLEVRLATLRLFLEETEAQLENEDDYIDDDCNLGVALEDGQYKVAIELPSGDGIYMTPEQARDLANGMLRCADEADKLEKQRAGGGA